MATVQADLNHDGGNLRSEAFNLGPGEQLVAVSRYDEGGDNLIMCVR